MEQSIIDNLPDILKNFTDTLEKISCDYSKKKKQYMTNSQKIAINFDKVKVNYSTQNGINQPKSNDALYITKNNIHYFIEFKNGNYRNIKKFDLIVKIYDSLFILSDIKYQNGNQYIQNIVGFSKNNINYILVYNSSSNSKSHNYNLRYYIKGKFGLVKFEKFLLKEIYIYDENKFETKFINGIIANES